MSDAETELAAALTALASDDDEQALECLVTAWDVCRAQSLAEVIDLLASRVEPRHKALAGKTADDRYQAFRNTAAGVRQADLARLVALLPRLAYGDLSTALDTLLYHWRYTPRMRALLADLGLTAYNDRVEELRVVHAAPRDEPLSDRARAAIAELRRLLTTTDDAGAELLAQVYADPDADAPRLVYADWATSRGDPRGELISLQFARRDRTPDAVAVRRERELLEQYMQRWLAPLWNAIRPYSVRFERGFLASVTVEPFAVIASLPAWSTVVALDLAYHDAVPMDAFPALRELRNVTPKLLAQIASRSTKLVHLGLATEPGPAEAIRVALRTPRATPVIVELTHGRAFPDLVSLGLWGYPEDWTWLWETPLGHRLERIEVDNLGRHASPWLTAALPASIREVRIRAGANEARFIRDGEHYPRVDVICREPLRDVLAWGHLLDIIPPSSLREARFLLPRRARRDSVERLERETRNGQPALERFTVEVDPFL